MDVFAVNLESTLWLFLFIEGGRWLQRGGVRRQQKTEGVNQTIETYHV